MAAIAMATLIENYIRIDSNRLFLGGGGLQQRRILTFGFGETQAPGELLHSSVGGLGVFGRAGPSRQGPS